MEITVSFDEVKKRDILVFSEELTDKEIDFLKETIGFLKHFRDPKIWYNKFPKHPAYQQFIKDLKVALAKGNDITSVKLLPSYDPTKENLKAKNYSYVFISLIGKDSNDSAKEDLTEVEYIVFDSFKKVALSIAKDFAKEKYGDRLKEVKVVPRNFLVKARSLFKEGKVIGSALEEKESETPKQELVDNTVTLRDIKDSDVLAKPVNDNAILKGNSHLRANEAGELTTNLHNAGGNALKNDQVFLRNEDKAIIDKIISGFNKEGRYNFPSFEDPFIYKLTDYLKGGNIDFGETSQLGTDLVVYRTDTWNSSLKKIDHKKSEGGTLISEKIESSTPLDVETVDKEEPDLSPVKEKGKSNELHLNKKKKQVIQIEIRSRVGDEGSFHTWEDANEFVFKLFDRGEFITLYYTLRFEDGFEKEHSTHVPASNIKVKNKASYFSNSIYESLSNFSKKAPRRHFIEQSEIDEAKRIIAHYDFAQELNLQEVKKSKLIVGEVAGRDKKFPQVLLPAGSSEPFWSGNALYYKSESARNPTILNHHNLSNYHLEVATAENLFQWAQMKVSSDEKDFIWKTLQEFIRMFWKKCGSELFNELQFSTDMNYPYANLYLGYEAIEPLGKLLNSDNEDGWLNVVQHYRPIADIKGVSEELLKYLDKERDSELLRGYEKSIETLERYRESLRLKIDSDYLTKINLELNKKPDEPYSSLIEFQLDIHRQIRIKTNRSAKEAIEAVSLMNLADWWEESLEYYQLELDSVDDFVEELIIQEAISKTPVWIKMAVNQGISMIYSSEVNAKESAAVENMLGYARLEVKKLSFQEAITLFWRYMNSHDKFSTSYPKEGSIDKRKEQGASSYPTKPNNKNSIPGEIEGKDKKIPNVLLPEESSEPFWSGNIYRGDSDAVHASSPNLKELTDNNLHKASALELFELSQMAHPDEYGLQVTRSRLLKEWTKRGAEGFREIGYPSELNYLYVNAHVGYRNIEQLGTLLGQHLESWWSVVENNRPIADMEEALNILDHEIRVLEGLRLPMINPKTNKPRGKQKDEYQQLTFDLEYYLAGKEVVLDYIKSKKAASKSKDQKTKALAPERKKQENNAPTDYLDKVIAYMHDAYVDDKRLSKGKVEALAKTLGVPNMGIMWEAVELSWLLWYKMIYREPEYFEVRLSKMIRFWDKVQPTYAYSDSSKEVYKQYSTSCPIGAIVAEYTGMRNAKAIFEPSAGNGLLVLGANPSKTHVNEIDKTRLKSLKFQGFKTITTHNAIDPFPEELTKKFDVVITNPPFAKWEESKFDKDRIVTQYFNGQIGLKKYLRLEHVMSGLALHTLKDNGKAALVILGHVYYDESGLFRKFRPFFNWLYRHYKVDEVINMNSYKLYNKQGAVAETMLVLISGRKHQPSGVSPKQEEAPHLEDIVNTFQELWLRVKRHIKTDIDTVINQLKTALDDDIL